MIIIRMVYTKKGMMKFLGHLDLMRFFERAFRRLQLPLSFSQGFNPHAKMNFGGPLSVGVASNYEVMEVSIDKMIDLDKFIADFNQISPAGIKITAYKIIEKGESLMHALALSRYRFKLPLKYNLIERFQQAEKIILKKKNKRKRWVEKDLKSFVYSLEVDQSDDSGLSYLIAIKSLENGSAKPIDIIAILLKDEPDFIKDDVDIIRTGMYFQDKDGQYLPLLDL